MSGKHEKIKIAVFSDSHNDTEIMKQVMEIERPGVFIHLGDHYSDGEVLRDSLGGVPAYLVRGNCDGSRGFSEMLIELCGKKFFVTHGHNYGVKGGIAALIARGAMSGADVVLFGHTHKAIIENAGGITLMNPGRAGRVSKNITDASYGIIDIDGGEMDCKIVHM